MKKKVFSLMMTLVLAFAGVARAQQSLPYSEGFENGIGGWTLSNCHSSTAVTTTSNYVHSGTSSFAYHWSTTPPQYLISPELSGANGGLDVEFYYKAGGTSYSETFQVGYSTTTNAPNAFTFEAEVTAPGGGSWTAYTTSFPAGTKFVSVKCTSNDAYWFCVDDFTFTAVGGSVDPVDPTPGPTIDNGPIHVAYTDANDGEIVDQLNLGTRPAGAWMAPFQFRMFSDGPTYKVTDIDFTPADGLFTIGGEEMPFQINGSTDADLTISTNVESTLTGLQERMIVAFTEGDRAAHIWPITVELYTPAVPDVVEKAYNLGTINANFVYDGDPSRITPTTLHNDYTLPFPEIEEGQDAVYKFTVASDMVLNAYVDENAENGKVALYTADFYGEGGPMAHNNYEGDIMSVNGGGQGGAAFEATIGSESATSSTTRAPFYPYFENSYSTILYLASELNEASVTTAPMSSLSWYANSVTGYATEGVKVWIGNYAESSLPSTTPNVNNMSYVFQGSVTPVVGWNEFAFNQGSFAWDGHSNILVCVQHNHPGVYHSGQTWRAENVGYNAVGYDYDDDIVFDLANNTYSFYGTETYRPITKMKATGSRDDSRAIVSIGERTGTSYYYPVNMYYRFSVTQQLYTAEEIGTAGIINSISFDYTYSGTIDEKPNVQLYMMNTDKQSFENNSDWVNYADATLVWNGPIEANGAGWVTLTLDTPFYYDGTSNLLVAFNDMSNDWDGTSFTFGTYNTPNYGCLYAQRDGSTPYDLNSLPSGSRVMNRNNIQLDITPSAPVGGFLAGPVIEDLPIVAGTYYLVASATQDSYMVHIGTQSMPCPEVAYGPVPEDDADHIDPAAGLTLHWNLPNFATEWRLVFGTTYYPEEGHDQTIITDWSRELAYSYTIPFALWNNTNYFWHIDVRNSDGTITSCPFVSGPIWGFTTHMNIPQNLTVVDDAVFEDEEVVLNWSSVVDRTYRWYHVYRTDLRDGSTVLLDHTTVNDPSATHFVDNTIEYNMVGYEYYVTAVYDEGESDPSNRVTVKVSGYSNTTGINGYVYEQDSITPIGGVTVTVDGTDEFGDPHTYTAVTGQNGYYHMQVYVGNYTNAIATMEGYQDAEPYQNGPEFFIAHEASHDNMNFIMDELFIAPAHVCAEKVYVPSAEGDTLVKVWWDFNFFTTLTEDFEDWANTPYAWQNDAQYPWTLTTEAHEGTYALKSGNAGMGGTTSTLEVTVDIPQDGMFSFDLWSRGESTTDTYDWDVSRFYIDGQQKFQYGQHAGWETYSTAITAGTHTFRWVYKKDATVNPAQGDCFMIDNIKFVYNPDDRAVSFEPDRALNHYRIYRTNCYYYGPYYEGDPGGTIVLASAWVPDTAYFDVSWPITEPGVYKWGVGVVYEGNNPNNPNNGRESEITWSQNGSRDVIFSDDFENGLGNWTAVDVDGDGYNWELVDPETSLDIYANSGVSCAGSYSWMGLTGGLNPNNYMISPLVEGATNISYFVNVNSLYRDTYAVMASTTGNNVADFSIVFTETPSDSKSGAVHEANGNNRGGRDIWVDRSVDLPAGTKYVAFRHYNSYDMNFLLIDDVIITAGGAPTPGPTPGPTPEGDPTNYLALDRESETVWSDMCSPCIDKDMYIPNVSVNVVLNSHDSPEGTVVSFTNTNIYEEAFYPMGSVTLPESGYYAFDSFRRGEYIVNVTHEGYYPIVDTVDLWNGGDLRYVMTEILYPVKNLYVSRTGWAMWEPMTDADGIYPEDLEGYRHLEYYKVMCTSIDNEPIFNHNTPASQPFCQLTTVDPHSGLPFLLEGERYKVKVCAIYSTGQSAWCPPVIFQYEPCDHWGPVDEVTYNPSTAGNHIEWVFEHGHNQWVGPVNPDDPQGEMTVLLHEDFNGLADDAIQPGWTVAGGDDIYGETWFGVTSASFGIPFPSGSNAAMMSASYWNGSCTPDNWLFTPEFTDARKITYTYAVNTAYPGDHYAVLASTTGNNIADFSVVFEETPTGRDNGENGKFAPGRSDRWEASWVTREVELPAGTKYIAFHHYDCYDMNFLLLDEVTVEGYNGGAKGGNNIAAYKSEPVYRQYSDDALTLNFLALDNVDFRAYLLYNLIKDTRFVVVAEGNYGQFIVSANEERSDFGAMFEEFYSNVEANFATLTKTDISDQMTTWKTGIGSQFFLSITMDMYTSSIRTENDRCINSLPFCTTDLYEFESAYSGQTADDLEGTTLQDGCIGSSYNPSWYHMRVREDGQFIIHLEGHDPNNATTTRDVDFCIWGPFTDPTEPCVDQLTTDKIIDCSFSASYTEDIYLGYPDSEHDHGYADHGTINYHVPQTGEYYILMLTNYSNNPCVVSFTKTEGEGETDCDIVTPSDIIGFLITQDGEYLDIVGPDVRDYTDVDEFGDHVYCVRPIYPGPAILPDTNYYFSMGCPVCVSTNGGEILCDAGDPINSEVIDEQVHLWWGEAPVPPVPGENSFTESFDNDLNGWHVLDVNAGQGTWLHSTNQPYGHDYTGLAHSGAGFALCYSFVDYTGSFDTDSYLYTPQMYDIEAGSTLTFWADNANDDYPESFSVCVATAENPTAADFVQVWSGSAKEAAGQKAAYRHNANRYENWRAHSVDLSAFAGQRVWIAFHDVNYDMYEVWIDDVELSVGAKANRAEIEYYNVYRSEDNVDYTLIGTVPANEDNFYEYFDAPGSGTYYYQVTAVYSDGCESDPAVSAENPSQNYVVVGVTGIDENNDNVALFPNPTKGNVTIQAKGMHRVTVVSVLGQVVYDNELSADECTVNMSQFSAGMYMVRVYTENGMAVKRVTVMQ